MSSARCDYAITYSYFRNEIPTYLSQSLRKVETPCIGQGTTTRVKTLPCIYRKGKIQLKISAAI